MKKIVFLIILSALALTTFAKIAEPFGVMDSMRNSYIKIACSKYNGRFTIGTADGKKLLYNFPSEGSTSHTYVRFDTTSIMFGNYPGTITDSLRREGNSFIMKWTYADIDITQKLSIVTGASTGNDDTILIEYFITNRSGSNKSVGILLEMDTMINYNDAAPISTSFGYVAVEQDFLAPNIPQYWQAFEVSPTQGPDKLVGQGTLIGGSAVMPDRFCLGPWGTYNSVSWNYTSTGSPYGDSAVLLWWNPIVIPNGGTRRVGTLYGIGAGSVVMGELALNITAPLTLSVDTLTRAYYPNPFTVNALVTNTTTSTINGVTATITLPAGLSLASGETATKSVSPTNLNASQTGSVSWSVVAENRSTPANLIYTVRVNGGGYTNSGNRNITIPANTAAPTIRDVTLTIKKVNTSDFPNVRTNLAVVDNITNPLVSIPGLTASNFRVWEEETRISDFTLRYEEVPISTKDIEDEDEETPVDLVFVVDVSAYMEQYNTNTSAILGFLRSAADSTNRSFQAAIVTFTNRVEQIHDFSSDPNEIGGWMETAFVGSSNSPTQTCGLEAISRIRDFRWAEGSNRLIIFVTGAPFATGGSYTTMGTVNMLRNLNATIFVIGVDNPDMRMLADSTSGRWLPISFVNTVVDSLGNPVIEGDIGDVGPYTIIYQSPTPNPDGTWRDIHIEVVLDSFSDFDDDGYYAPTSAGLYFSPETTMTRNGLRFPVSVKAASMMNLYDVHFRVNFDPTKVRLDSVTVDELLARNASSPLRVITFSSGVADISITRNGSLVGVNGSGTLAKCFFTAIASDPTSTLRFSQVVVRDPDFVNIPTAVDTFAYIVYLSGTGSGNPGDPSDCLLCDFDCDRDIDTRDFTLLGTYWQPNNTALGDVGPASGLAPTIRKSPDGSVNYEDLFVFSRMWNWYHLTVLGRPRLLPVVGTVSLEKIDNVLTLRGIGLEPVGMAHFVIDFDPSRTEIIGTTLGDLPMGFVDYENGSMEIAIARLAGTGENAEISGNLVFANISYSGENTFSIRIADARNGNGEPVPLAKMESVTPREFSISPIAPNPFNPIAQFNVSLPNKGALSIDIFDINGHKITNIASGEFPAGTHSFEWNGKNIPSGIYFVRAGFGEKTIVRKAVLAK